VQVLAALDRKGETVGLSGTAVEEKRFPERKPGTDRCVQGSFLLPDPADALGGVLEIVVGQIPQVASGRREEGGIGDTGAFPCSKCFAAAAASGEECKQQ